MSYPLADLTTRRVVATYLDEVTGRPVRGRVTFTPQSFVRSQDLATLLVPTPVTVRLDATGSLRIDLPVNADPDYTPAIEYQIVETFRLDTLPRDPYVVTIPAGDGDFNLIPAGPN